MRKELGKALRLLVLVVAIAVLIPSALAQERKLGTIGPPPRKNPERQTAAEGMPPLPRRTLLYPCPGCGRRAER